MGLLLMPTELKTRPKSKQGVCAYVCVCVVCVCVVCVCVVCVWCGVVCVEYVYVCGVCVVCVHVVCECVVCVWCVCLYRHICLCIVCA